MSPDVLERFHRALIEEIQTQRPEYLVSPFTVAEIYQNLVPYGSHRDRIGVEMNGDYEDALVRLLAGEGGYLVLESEAAVGQLKAELQTPNPNTGLYREYAAVDVRLNPTSLDLSATAMERVPDLASELDAEDPVTIADLAPAEETAAVDPMGLVGSRAEIFDAPPTMTEGGAGKPPRRRLAPEFVDPNGVEGSKPKPDASEGAGATSPAAPAASAAAETACKWCRAPMPEREGLNFCPFCGTSVGLIPCDHCGAELEPGWRFCAACGSPADD